MKSGEIYIKINSKRRQLAEKLWKVSNNELNVHEKGTTMYNQKVNMY